LAAMGSPDERQIDGVGGANPLTSKVAIISSSSRDDADVDYLFLQISVDRPLVSDSQNCGNLLAGVGPYAIEAGMLESSGDVTPVRVHMVNTGGLAVVHVQTAGGTVCYDGESHIDGVPGTSAPVKVEFSDIAGASCGSLLPTGNSSDVIDGVPVTCIDNGMPVVIMRAEDLGKTGYETPDEMESDTELCRRVEIIRLQAGDLMNLGDVEQKTVPKMTLVSAPRHGGAINTRTFIPHRVHDAIGVLGAVSVATACALPGSIAESVVGASSIDSAAGIDVEHPTGLFTVEVDLTRDGNRVDVNRAVLLRTARMLMRGDVYVPAHLWTTQA
ncbi:MAG: 4-oxalomesaconate tautomerase, partial [Pseudomonadales bacterium]